ncbi:MAG: hypothetical protein L6R42_009964 [Xanthoria sp. 1 TBL-2021]|nr:MAG: hypothetical protein L6R42_009964 [Xanthoria sp. 1 TBL-2021]
MLRLPTSMGLREENVQNLTNDGFGFVWEQSTASVSELDGSMNKDTKPIQYPVIGAVEVALALKRAGFYPTPELEAQHSQPSEPQGSQQWTSYIHVPAELSDDFDHRQPLELDGSTAFNSNTEYRWPSSKPFSNDNHPRPAYPTHLSVLPEQLPQRQASAKEEAQLETPARRSGTAPSRFTFPRYGSSTNRLPIDNSTMYPSEQSSFSTPNEPFSPPVNPYMDRHHDPTTTKRNCVSLQSGQSTNEWPLGRFLQTPTSTNQNKSIGQETSHGDHQDQLYNNPTSNPDMTTPYAFREPNLSSPSLTLPRSDPIPRLYDAGKRTLYPVPLFSEDAHHTTDHQEQLWAISPLGSLKNNFTSSSSIVSPLSSDGAQGAHADEARLSPLIPVAAPSPSKPLPPLPLSKRSSGETSQTSTSTQPTSTEVSPVSADFTTASTDQSRKTRGVSKCLQCATEFNGSFQDRKANLKRHIQYCHGRPEKFKCPINGCTKEYSRPDNLMKHRRIVHEDVLPLRRSNAHKVRRSF